MNQIHICKTRINSLNLPGDYQNENIMIGIPVAENEADVVKLRKIGDVILPSAEFGSVCNKNAYGSYYLDKTKPKERRYVSTNWIYPYGNIYASKEAVDIYKDCWQKIEIVPTELELTMCEGSDNKNYIIALLKQFDNESIKLAVNIFLEIFGHCYIFKDKLNIDEKTLIKCNWEILPPGEKPSMHLKKQLQKAGKDTDIFDIERLSFLDRYQTEKIVEGINGFKGYYAYIFKNYCFLESAIYGNATYIIPKENWENLSQKTKQQLTDNNFVVDKIIHTEKWKYKVKKALERFENQ